MRYRIGDIVETKWNHRGTVVETFQDTAGYLVEIGCDDYLYSEEELTLIYSLKGHYWQGFDKGFHDQVENSARTFTSNKDVWVMGYKDGVDFAHQMMTNKTQRSTNNDAYEAGYDQGYNDATNGISFDKTVTGGKYSEKYDDGYITGYYHGRSSKKTNS